MKAERQPLHTPLPREDVAVKNGDDFTESFSKLTINNSSQSKSKNIVKSESKNERHAALNCKTNIKSEAKTKEKEAKEISTKSNAKNEDEKEKSKVKDEEKTKEKDEPLGELCSRGPDRKGYATQSRNTTIPYIIAAHPQINTSLNNGGIAICNPTQTQLSPSLCYPPSVTQPIAQAPDYHSNHCAPLPMGHSHFTNNITNYPHTVCDCSDFQHEALSPSKPDALSPGKPEGFDLAESEAQHCNLDDNTAIEIIQAVTSDPTLRDLLLEDLQDMNGDHQNIPKIPIDQSPHSSYGSLSPASSPQVVPRLSPYSVSFGSPPGPSSPNIPIFSPNIPSPGGPYSGDESSNNMYPSMPPPQRKQDYFELDYPDLDSICNEPLEGKKLEEKKIVQELLGDCSTPKTGHPPLPIIPTVATLLPVIIKPTANNTPNTPRYRAILPKTSEDNRPKQPTDKLTRQESSNGMDGSPIKGVLPERLAKEQFRERLNKSKVKIYWPKVFSRSEEDISHVDDDGDTNVTIVLSNPKEYSHEKFYAIVERCREVPHVFSIKNKCGHTPLFLASVLKHDDPLVAKYIAETMIDIRINWKDLDKDGSTIIHQLCNVDDRCAYVIDELLSLRDEHGKPYFDVNKHDKEGVSPLHVAVKKNTEQSKCLQVVNVLLKHGANIGGKGCGQKSNPLNSADKPDQNPMHILCKAMNERGDLVNTKDYYDRSMASGASLAVCNHNGKVPYELVSDSRKAGVCS